MNIGVHLYRRQGGHPGKEAWKTVQKWDVEYRRTNGKYGYMEGVVAKDGKEAIGYVKSKVYDAWWFKVFHNEEPEEERTGTK